MKVKTKTEFYDRKEGVMRKIGDVFEVTPEREKQVRAYTEIVNPIKEQQETKDK